MKYRKPLSFLAALAPLFLTGTFLPHGSHASPLVSVGDNADIFFNGSGSVRWVSNVFRDDVDEVDDLLYTVSPGFELNVGRGLTNADLSVSTRLDILRYADQDQLDTELFSIRAAGSYQASRLDVNGSLSFAEQQTSAGDENLPAGFDDLIESEELRGNIDAEYRYSPKFSFGFGARYTQKEYVTFQERFSDRERLRLPLDVFYELTPKVDLSGGYQYENSDVDGSSVNRIVFVGGPPVPAVQTVTRESYDFNTHFFNLGARGNLLPKLNGFFKVGYRLRESADRTTTRTGALPGSDTNEIDEKGMLGLDADFTWAMTPKFTSKLALSRDFGVGGEGESTENSSINVLLSYAISTYVSASGNLGYTLRDYANSDREDDQYSLGGRLSYRPNEYWQFGAGYTFSENESTDGNRDYVNHIFDLSASLRY